MEDKKSEKYRRVVTPPYAEQAMLDWGLGGGAFVICCIMGILFGMAVVQYVPMALVGGVLVYVRGLAWWLMNRKVTYEKDVIGREGYY